MHSLMLSYGCEIYHAEPMGVFELSCKVLVIPWVSTATKPSSETTYAPPLTRYCVQTQFYVRNDLFV